MNFFFLLIRLICKLYGVLGEDYPRPMVKHEVVSKENIARHKKAYDAGLCYRIFSVQLFDS